jgi:hypothetical protein
MATLSKESQIILVIETIQRDAKLSHGKATTCPKLRFAIE